jgi:exopolysaccharide biosynthesis polyprenyl glycosylphosphotransferase
VLDRLLAVEPDVFAVPVRGGIDARRVTTTAFANETLLHVDAAQLSPWAWGVKRLFDVVVSVLLIILISPLLAVIALAIKTDGGPVLFRQLRVGRDDEEFAVLKFRTMVVDAEARLAELQAANARSGPLFKMAVDPRVTRVGRILRATSLDELPQLFNVVRGEMSLVGPRPALRKEVDAFPPALRQRHGVRPGITGLWQVEARDNPAFDAYERLDLFYVKNWSLALDVVIILGTVEQLVLRPFVGRKTGEMAAAGAGGGDVAAPDGDQSSSISA